MDPEEICRQYFEYDLINENNRHIIESILENNNDILAYSHEDPIVYLIPAIMSDGVTIVISSDLTTLKNQVQIQKLQNKGISISFIESNTITTILSSINSNECKIIYVSPDCLKRQEFKEFVNNLNVAMIVINDAHCILSDQIQYNPDYRNIRPFINTFSSRPMVCAFTNLITSYEENINITNNLNLLIPLIFSKRDSFSNLYFKVEHISSKQHKNNYIINYIYKHTTECGIIYSHSNDQVDELYNELLSWYIPTTKYHAELSEDDKENNIREFVNQQKPYMITTADFVMRINRRDIRFVIHYHMPTRIQDYYNEVCVGGRDGKRTICILLYTHEDAIFNINKIGNDQQLKAYNSVFNNYCKHDRCYRSFIQNVIASSNDYGDEIHCCYNCDNCLKFGKVIDMTKEAKIVIQCIWETQYKNSLGNICGYGLNNIANILKGKIKNDVKYRTNKLIEKSTYGALKDYPLEIIKALIEKMIEKNYIQRSSDSFAVLQLKNTKPLNNDNEVVCITLDKNNMFFEYSEEEREFLDLIKTPERNPNLFEFLSRNNINENDNNKNYSNNFNNNINFNNSNNNNNNNSNSNKSSSSINSDNNNNNNNNNNDDDDNNYNNSNKSSSSINGDNNNNNKYNINNTIINNANTNKLLSNIQNLLKEMLALRKKISKQEQKSPSKIFSTESIVDMCIKQPKNDNEFLMIEDIKGNQYIDYRKDFLNVIDKYQNSHRELLTKIAGDIEKEDRISITYTATSSSSSSPEKKRLDRGNENSTSEIKKRKVEQYENKNSRNDLKGKKKMDNDKEEDDEFDMWFADDLTTVDLQNIIDKETTSVGQNENMENMNKAINKNKDLNKENYINMNIYQNNNKYNHFNKNKNNIVNKNKFSHSMPSQPTSFIESSTISNNLRKELDELRTLISSEMGIYNKYYIFNDNILDWMSKHPPLYENDLLSINGIDSDVLKIYEEEFLRIFCSYLPYVKTLKNYKKNSSHNN